MRIMHLAVVHVIKMQQLRYCLADSISPMLYLSLIQTFKEPHAAGRLFIVPTMQTEPEQLA